MLESEALQVDKESHNDSGDIIGEGDDIEAINTSNDGLELCSRVESGINLVKLIRGAYRKDTILSKVLEAPREHPRFGVQDDLIWTKNPYRCDIICIPREVFLKGRWLIEIIIDQAHQVGHFNHLKTSSYIRRSCWWPKMATDIESFCKSCATCQMNKLSTQKPQGLLHSLPILERPWQSVGMDFMGPLPKSDGYDYLLVVIDRLTAQVHLIPTDTRVTAKEVVRLHGIPDSIVSDRDPKFTLIFWHELLRIMDIKPLMSTAFHPQTDGSTEQVNCSIGQILWTVVHDDQKD